MPKAIVIAFAMIAVTHSAHARFYKTPTSFDCETVRNYYRLLGGLDGMIAYVRANNIEITPSQKRQALACLRGMR